MKKKYKVIGSCSVCGTLGIEVLEVIYNINDCLKVRYHNGEKAGKPFNVRIRCDEEGNYYINLQCGRVYLNEVLRTHI